MPGVHEGNIPMFREHICFFECKHAQGYNLLCTNLTFLRGWLHGGIKAEISARLLTYGKEKNNLNKKHEEVCIKI